MISHRPAVIRLAVPGNEATTTKSRNTYTISGTATDTDNANAAVSKPFEIVATRP
jgi:hypothetical protein